MSPTFEGAVKDYDLLLPNVFASSSFVATPLDSTATIYINNIQVASGTARVLSFTAGTVTIVSVSVLAENLFTWSNYTVTVERLAG